MAILWADSFDHYGTTPNGGRDAMLSGAWAQLSHGSGSAPEVSTEQARTGTHSLKFAFNPAATDDIIARRVLGGDKTVAGVAFGLYLNALPTANDCLGFSFQNGSNASIARCFYQSDGSIGVTVDGVSIGSSDPVLGAASWNHIEAKLIVDEIVGSIEVRVNGVVVFLETDIDTGAAGAAAVRWGSFNDLASGLTFYIDDVMPWDDTGTENIDFVGTVRVQTLFAASDTAEADWLVVGAANGYEAIDDAAPDGDTTMLTSDTAGNISEFGLDTLPPEADFIAGVYIPTMAKLDDAGTGNIQVSLVSGVDVSAGPNQVLTTAYTYWGGVHQLDPATDAPWTKAGLEAARLRIEKTV